MKKEQIIINIDELKEYWKNNKIHWKDQIGKLKQSIQKVWYITDIYVDEKLEILAGHWRMQALKELWYEEISVIRVSWLNEKQKKTYRLLDNKISDMSEYNEDNIKLEVIEINDIELNEILWIDTEEINLDDIELGDIEIPEGNEGDKKEIECPNCQNKFSI